MIKKGKLLALIGASLGLVASVILIICNIRDSYEDTSTEEGGIIIGVGDNDNDNSGEKVTAEDRETTEADKEEVTTEAPREVDEQLGKIAGNWAVKDGGSVFEFIPARGNEAILYFYQTDTYLKGKYETDDKTYIKVNYADVYDNNITGVIEFEILGMEINSFGGISLLLKDKETNVEYYMTPSNIF